MAMDWDNESFEKEIEIERANEIIQDALELCQKGNIKAAIYLTMRAIEIYLNIGVYLQISPAFNQLATFVQKETEILLIMEKVQNIIVELEYLDLQEEIAKLKLVLSVLAYKQENYHTAANLYQETADLFFSIDPEEYRQASTMFLLRAAECFEKINRMERAKRLVFKAIQMNNTSIFDYPTHFQKLIKLIQTKKYEQAVNELREIAKFFRDLCQGLKIVEEFSQTFEYLKNNVLTRLIHMISEFNLLKMMCYRHLGLIEQVKDQAKKSIDDLKRSIKIFKDEIKKSHYTSADLQHLTFIVFLLQVFQEFADYQIEDPRDLILRDVPLKIQEIIQKLDFFKYTVKIVESDLRQCIDLFEDLPFSHILAPFRNFIQQSLKQLNVDC
ncbi:MAG: hypothetical protein K9W44_01955 [Candidatus Lokiarchaeota archaeon]|nr:hypothetical protein [Candidatus Harpocratesius repetitus]